MNLNGIYEKMICESFQPEQSEEHGDSLKKIRNELSKIIADDIELSDLDIQDLADQYGVNYSDVSNMWEDFLADPDSAESKLNPNSEDAEEIGDNISEDIKFIQSRIDGVQNYLDRLVKDSQGIKDNSSQVKSLRAHIQKELNQYSQFSNPKSDDI